MTLGLAPAAKADGLASCRPPSVEASSVRVMLPRTTKRIPAQRTPAGRTRAFAVVRSNKRMQLTGRGGLVWRASRANLH
jgi:hypothetical protein